MMHLLVLSLIITGAYAAEPSAAKVDEHAAPSLLAPHSSTVLPNEVLRLQPIEHHHVNVKAPYSCGTGGKVVSISARFLECQFPQAGEYKVSLGICDDAVTFCKIEKLNIVAKGKSASVDAPAFDSNSKLRLASSPAVPTKQVQGFLTNDIGKAVSLSRQGKKLLLVDFFGAWCPPCNELEEYVFDEPEFQEATKDFVRLRLDADTHLAWKWRDKFRITGLPTLLLMTPAQEEIGRVMGYRPLAAMVKKLGQLQALRAVPISVARKDRSPAARLRVAHWYLDREEPEKVAAVLKGLAIPEARLVLLRAQTTEEKRKGDEPGRLATIEQLIKEFPENLLYGEWVSILLENDRAKGEKYADSAIQSLEKWRVDPRLGEQDVDDDPADLLMFEGSIYDSLKNESKKNAAYLAAAQYLEEQVKKSPLKLAKGSNLRRAEALQNAGHTQEAEALYRSLAETYSDQFTFNYRYGRALLDLGQLPKALEYASKAESQTYGDNWLKVAAVKAKILIKMGRKDEARKYIEATLAEVELPSSTSIWTHYRVKDLRELLTSLESGQSG